MKLSLRYFLLAAILLGAVAIPWAYQHHLELRAQRQQKALAAEVERLKAEQAKAFAAHPFEFRSQPLDPFDPYGTEAQKRRIEELGDRLERLTGRRYWTKDKTQPHF